MQIAILIFLLAVLGIWCGFTIRDIVQLFQTETQCPHCGIWLIQDDVFDEEALDDDSAIIEKRSGHCHLCHREFIWKTEFRKYRNFELEEVE